MPVRPASRWLAYVSGAFGLAATAQINFVLPLRARELGASFEVIGLLVGAGAIVPAILAVTTGALIDRLGARRAFIIGTVATGLLAAVCVLVTNYWWFFAVQPVLGAARNLGWLASQAYITGIGAVEDRQRDTGRFSFFTSAGQTAAPALIGFVAEATGHRAAFLFLAAYSLVFSGIGLLLAPLARTTLPPDARPHGIGIATAIELLRSRPIQVVLLLSGLRLWITWIYTAFVPVYLVDNGLPTALAGTVLAAYGVAAAVVAPTLAFWTRFASPAAVATVAMVGGAAALFLAPHLTTVPLVYLVPVLIGVSQGLSLPVILTIVATSAPPGKRGVALGLRAAMNQATAAAGPVFVGTLISASGIVLGFTVGGAVALAMVLTAHLLQEPRASAPAG